MPKIKTIKRTIAGKEYSFNINVSASGEFYTKLPDIMIGKVYTANNIDTLGDVINDIDRCIKEYNQLEEKVEFLIYYRVTITQSGFLNEGLSVGLIYAMFKKVTIGNEVTFYSITKDTFGDYEGKNGGTIPGYHVLKNKYSNDFHDDNRRINTERDNYIPLTAKNIAFLEDFSDRLTKLYDSLSQLLGDKTKILEAIEGNVKLLGE